MRKNISILFILLALALSAFGQKVRSTMGSLADAKTDSFSSVETGFSIDLPKGIHGAGLDNGIQYNWRLTEGYFTAGMVERDRDVENGFDFEGATIKVADNIFDRFVADYFETKPDIIKIDKNTGVYQGHKGMEFRILLRDSICLIRVFWVKSRAFTMGVLLLDKQDYFESQAIKVFDSMRLLDPGASASIIRKKVEENTPAPMPQTPIVKRRASDAMSVNLKGKVKEVYEESQYITGPNTDAPRGKDKESYYNEAGDLVKTVEYGDGLPQMITAYGYINGFRVSTEDLIQFESSPPPGMATVPPGGAKRRDNRYQTRYTYKYNAAGQLIETLSYDNLGVLDGRIVTTIKGSVAETIYYTSAGRINDRLKNTIDERGNPVKTVNPDSPEKGQTTTYTYKYLEFDAQGNWTKRTRTVTRTPSASDKDEGTVTQYRTIIYY